MIYQFTISTMPYPVPDPPDPTWGRVDCVNWQLIHHSDWLESFLSIPSRNHPQIRAMVQTIMLTESGKANMVGSLTAPTMYLLANKGIPVEQYTLEMAVVFMRKGAL